MSHHSGANNAGKAHDLPVELSSSRLRLTSMLAFGQ